MAYGDVMTQPGYRAPTRPIMGPRQSYSRSYQGPAPRRAMGGGLGFPSYGAAVQPRRPGGGGGGGGAAQAAQVSYGGDGGAGGGGVQTDLNVPPAQQFQPGQYGDPNLDYMASYAKGLMDPESDYYKRLSAGMQQQIGAQSAAQQRAAALRQAWGGGGTGQTGELMQTTADISQAGLEAQGVAEANLRLAAPQLGMQGLQSTFQPQLGYGQLTEGSRQYGAGLSEGARQYGGNLALQQQQLAAQQAQARAAQQAQLGMFNVEQQNRMAMQQAQNEWELMMQQMAQSYA